MQSLEEMRKELDVIDDQITTLYERRMKVCEGVAEYKIKNGRKVFDKTRENEKLAEEESGTGSFILYQPFATPGLTLWEKMVPISH